ncbi:MAG: replicative DNA helicase, partial [Flavobacteriaceae bacterium]|nr:replicative DNA helicase [Flavobacteriaceae bacterium]
LDNIRLKFIGSLGKFDNLDDFGTPFDAFPSKMNVDDMPFNPSTLPSPNEAFGSSMNSNFDDNSDVPF